MSYSFYIEISSVYTKFNPFFDNCTLNATLEGNARKIEKFNGELLFKGNEYSILRNEFVTNELNYLNIIVYKNSTIEFRGLLNLRGRYNLKENVCYLKVDSDDRYRKLTQQKDIEYNFLLYNKYTVNINKNSFELTKYSECTSISQDDYRNYYLIISGDYETGASYINDGSIIIAPGMKRYVWYFEVFGNNYESEIISTDTTLDPDDYIAANPGQFPPDYVYFLRRTYNGCTLNIWRYRKQVFNFDPGIAGYTNEYLNYWTKPKIGIDSITESYYRFCNFFEALQKFLESLDNTITISPLTYCTYFNDYFPDYLNLYFAQKSDIKRPSATYHAYVLNTTFEKLMTIIKLMFNLDWYLDNSNNFLFKHPREFVETIDTSIVLTSSRYDNLMEYNVKENLNIDKEVWNFEATADSTFSTGEIAYSSANTEIKVYDNKEVNNDIMNISDSLDVDDLGFVFVNTDSSLNVINKVVNGVELVNGMMSYYYLVENHMRTGDRPYSKDIDGNVLTNIAKFNEHIEIDFYLDYFSSLDFSKLVKTQLTENLGLPGARKMSVVQQLNKNFATIKLEF